MIINEVLRGDELLKRYQLGRYTFGANPKAKICSNFDHRRLRTYSSPSLEPHFTSYFILHVSTPFSIALWARLSRPRDFLPCPLQPRRCSINTILAI